MIIDSHIHLFPDQLCPQTVEKLARANPDVGLHYHYDGSYSGAQEARREAGIDLSIMLPIATNPQQTQNVNDFAAWVQRQNAGIVAFGSVHPDDPAALAEIDRIVERGLLGVKLHPDYQGFFVAEPRLAPIYERLSDKGLPVVFHTGIDPISPQLIHATPAGMRAVAERYPELVIVAAHTGGLCLSDTPFDFYRGLENLYFDTSMAPFYCRRDDYLRLLDIYGPDRFLFGTDGPWGSGSAGLDFIRSLQLSPAEEALIFEKNVCKIINLPC